MTKITVLCNDKAKDNFYFEHGFSALIEKDDTSFIFDTGSTDVFLKNLKILGKDINKIDNIVISHGHYDHFGGLRFLNEKEKRFNLWTKDEIFIPKYSKKVFAGIKKEELKDKYNFNIVKDDVLEIFPKVFILGKVPMKSGFEEIDRNFEIKENESYKKDHFNEELNLVIDDGKLILITGCAHRGIVNIVNFAIEKFNKRIDIVLGGFHLYNSSKKKLELITKYLNEKKINKLIPCHCTGDSAIKIFKEKFKGEVIECLAGESFVFY
ncbi:MAG: MBL fold metallo-hydrolase [Caldisericia bacterium]